MTLASKVKFAGDPVPGKLVAHLGRRPRSESRADENYELYLIATVYKYDATLLYHELLLDCELMHVASRWHMNSPGVPVTSGCRSG
jgi:hypothetical protein